MRVRGAHVPCAAAISRARSLEVFYPAIGDDPSSDHHCHLQNMLPPESFLFTHICSCIIKIPERYSDAALHDICRTLRKPIPSSRLCHSGECKRALGGTNADHHLQRTRGPRTPRTRFTGLGKSCGRPSLQFGFQSGRICRKRYRSAAGMTHALLACHLLTCSINARMCSATLTCR